jgi:FixJ family two-component response regulator
VYEAARSSCTPEVRLFHARPVVFIVDDDPSVRDSLKLFVESAGWQPETFASGREFLAHGQVLAPSCLVLDLNLPDFSGLDLQTQLADRTDMPIIFISGYGDVPMAVRAMRAGAVEFLTKPLHADALMRALEDALDRSRAGLRNAARIAALRDSFAALSRREKEVMALVVSGRLNKQVGGELGISEITVKAHRGRMMKKMKAGTLSELVRMAERLHPTLSEP